MAMFRSSYIPPSIIQSVEEIQETTIFYLKLKPQSCDKVYIRYQCLNGIDQNVYEEEMQILKEKDDEIQYIVKLQLRQKWRYKYQYIQERMDQKEAESNFRNFQEQKGINLVDEWNKVWCLYRIKWPNQSLFENYEITLEREGLDSLKFKNTRTFFLTQDCKELQDNDYSKKTRRFVFRNRENNDVIKSNEFSAMNGQGFHMNQIDWDFSVNLLPIQESAKFKIETSKLNQNQQFKNVQSTEYSDEQNKKEQRDLEEQILQNQKSIKMIKAELQQKEQDKEQLLKHNIRLQQEIVQIQNQSAIKLNQFEIQKKFDLQKEKKQNQEVLDKIRHQFTEQLNNIAREKEEFESFAYTSFAKFKQEIEQLQKQLCQKIVDSSVEQGAANATRIKELENNVQIFESEEIKKSYENLKNSYDLLEKEKQECVHYSLKNEKNTQILQRKLQMLQKSAQECSNDLELYIQKVEKFEKEQQNLLKKNEKYQQTIIKIKEQLNQSQKDLSLYKESLANVQQQLQKATEQNSHLQEQIKLQEEQYQKQKDESQQELNKIKYESEIMLQQTTQNNILELEKLQEDIKQKQIEQEKLRKNQLLNFMKNNLDLLQTNILGDYFKLQHMYSAEVIKNINAEMHVLIIDKLEFVKKYVSRSFNNIQQLFYQGFDLIKNDSTQQYQNIQDQIRSMRKKKGDQKQLQLLESITKFQQFGSKILDVVKNQENIDETENIEQINKNLKKLDLTRDSITLLVETKNEHCQELSKYFTSQNEIKKILAIQFNDILRQINGNEY